MPSQEHEALVAMLSEAAVGAGTVEESRAAFEAMLSMVPVPEDVNVESLTINGFDADWVSAPDVPADRVVLYLHGGGYVIGSNVAYRELASRISRATNARVLLINYRLAPEHPHPAAVEDAVAAFEHILEQGIPAERVMVCGDSAGGGLTFATLVSLRDQGISLPGCAATFSPWIDLEATGNSHTPGEVDDPMLTTETVNEMAAHYAGTDLRRPLVSPLHANLSGLPPLLVFVGTREILRDDAIRIVDNAQSAGVSASLVIGDGLIHVWQLFPIPEAADSLEKVAAFMAKYIP